LLSQAGSTTAIALVGFSAGELIFPLYETMQTAAGS
jgi:hypothetical protein